MIVLWRKQNEFPPLPPLQCLYDYGLQDHDYTRSLPYPGLVQRKPGMLHLGSIGMRAQWTCDYGMQCHEETPRPSSPSSSTGCVVNCAYEPWVANRWVRVVVKQELQNAWPVSPSPVSVNKKHGRHNAMNKWEKQDPRATVLNMKHPSCLSLVCTRTVSACRSPCFVPRPVSYSSYFFAELLSLIQRRYAQHPTTFAFTLYSMAMMPVWSSTLSFTEL